MIMNISGVRPYMGYCDYNSISDTRLQAFESIGNETDAERSAGKEEQLGSAVQELARAREKQVFCSADYADTYQPNQTYELKGIESDIRSLDVQKAVSDMQKDQVIQQYQFFIGHSAAGKNSESPVQPRETEDFVL